MSIYAMSQSSEGHSTSSKDVNVILEVHHPDETVIFVGGKHPVDASSSFTDLLGVAAQSVGVQLDASAKPKVFVKTDKSDEDWVKVEAPGVCGEQLVSSPLPQVRFILESPEPAPPTPKAPLAAAPSPKPAPAPAPAPEPAPKPAPAPQPAPRQEPAAQPAEAPAKPAPQMNGTAAPAAPAAAPKPAPKPAPEPAPAAEKRAARPADAEKPAPAAAEEPAVKPAAAEQPAPAAAEEPAQKPAAAPVMNGTAGPSEPAKPAAPPAAPTPAPATPAPAAAAKPAAAAAITPAERTAAKAANAAIVMADGSKVPAAAAATPKANKWRVRLFKLIGFAVKGVLAFELFVAAGRAAVKYQRERQKQADKERMDSGEVVWMVLNGDLPITALSSLKTDQVLDAFDGFGTEDLQDLGVDDVAGTRKMLADVSTKLRSIVSQQAEGASSGGSGRRRVRRVQKVQKIGDMTKQEGVVEGADGQ